MLRLSCCNFKVLGGERPRPTVNKDFELVFYVYRLVTGPPNGPVSFCSLAFVVLCRLSSSVTLPADGRAGHRARGRSVGRPTLYTAGQ